eukprot:gene2672-3315_t
MLRTTTNKLFLVNGKKVLNGSFIKLLPSTSFYSQSISVNYINNNYNSGNSILQQQHQSYRSYFTWNESGEIIDSSNEIEQQQNNSKTEIPTIQQPKKRRVVKIKSKDPFLVLPDNKKIYLQPVKISKKKQQQLQQQHQQQQHLLNNSDNISDSSSLTQLIDNNNNTYFNPSIPPHGTNFPNILPFPEQQQNFLNLNNNSTTTNLQEQPLISNNLPKIKVRSRSSSTPNELEKDESILDNDVNSNNNNEINEESTTTIKNPTIRKSRKKIGLKDNDKKHTVLIDGTLLVYKAFNGAPNLSHNFIPIGAVYGFTRTLLKLLIDLEADYIGVCFDPVGKRELNFRSQIYPEYKAHRPPTDPQLIQQFSMIPEVTESLGIKFLQKDGFESDDLLATYSRLAQEEGHVVTIVSEDKDLYQLVNSDIRIYNPRKNQIIDENDVIEKFGLPPSLLTTYQSLVGDRVDNIPGILHLGPKGATNLVKELGSLDNILQNFNSIKDEKILKSIESSTEQLRINQQLVTLHKHVDIDIPINQLNYLVNKPKFLSFLEKYNFNSIIEQLPKLQLNYDNPEDMVIESNGSKKMVTQEAIEEFIPLSDEEVNKITVEDVTMVRTVEKAKEIVKKLRTLKYTYHACDTEVIDLDLKKESPIGHGRICCFSIYCGPNENFGTGSRIWVDTLDSEKGEEILQVFKEYFEDETILKVWHNYAFDRHILFNHGINVVGFGGDTLLMARLWDASRTNKSGYSLEALSVDLLDKQKISMKDLFGKQKINKDGDVGKSVVMPPIEQIQRHPDHLQNWIEYSSRDAELTWKLSENLHLKLMDMVWTEGTTMWDFYQLMWRPFGQLLTDMERRGMKVDIPYLRGQEEVATKDIESYRKQFKDWALKYSPGSVDMNIGSDAQIQQLLFGPFVNKKTKEELTKEKEFDCENVEGIIEPGKKKPLKKRKFVLEGIGMPVKHLTTNGWPAVDAAALRELCGSNPEAGKYGAAYEFFLKRAATPEEGEKEGREACLAINALLEVGSIGTLLNSFIIPLQKLADSNSRLHTSVNVNTETGRLSSRRPNLQNQPALEKDRYKVRKAFTCEPGNTLIVADYGQLELRLLAHITNCKSMIDAFLVGGDFHSRTAIGMYPHVRDAVDKGEVLLEWDGEGEPPKPLLKNIYGSERRKAKTLNFSIAYGKTAHGLSQDWGVTLKEAQETLNRWYEDRPEVLVWQRKTIETAHKHKWTRTLMGRYRHLPDIDNNAKGMKSHAERASINTPLQGGAADIVMKAMLIIEENKRLKELGFQLVMQIHDELILEGPEENADEAKEIVINLMSNPLTSPLRIDLIVDCRYAKTWYDAK